MFGWVILNSSEDIVSTMLFPGSNVLILKSFSGFRLGGFLIELMKILTSPLMEDMF